MLECFAALHLSKREMLFDLIIHNKGHVILFVLLLMPHSGTTSTLRSQTTNPQRLVD